MSVTFDGNNRLIILDAGTTSIDLAYLYSRYKDWLRTGNNANYAPFFDTVGGESIDPVQGTIVPLYLFLLSGARIRPQEANHTLNVTGGTLLVNGGGDPFVDTIGNYRVRVRYSQPVQAIGYSTGGGSGVSAADIWQYAIESGLTAENILRLLVAQAAGDATGLDTGNISFKSVDKTKTRINGSISGGNRTITGLDGT